MMGNCNNALYFNVTLNEAKGLCLAGERFLAPLRNLS